MPNSKIDTIGEFPIIAWYGISRNESNHERYNELRQSGITHNFTTFINANELASAMDIANKVGIKMIIDCPELKSEPEKTVKRFIKHPALAGYFIKDEPGRESFSELRKTVKRIQFIDKKNFCYINLLPNYATTKSLGTNSYRDYVKQFIREVPVSILSFDNYPIIEDSKGKRIVRDGWYENLEIISEEARNANKPFWAFARTVAFGSSPIPTEAEIRLQVFSNLAYGAQGIQYFTYWTPTPSSKWNFHNAPIDFKNKKRTQVYNYIQKINQDIKSLSPIFLDSKVQSIEHTGRIIPKGTKRLKKLPNEITKFSTEGTGAIVSVLKKNNISYLVVVNRDFTQEMIINIESDHNLVHISNNGKNVKLNDKNNRILVGAGNLSIFKWEN